MKITIECNDLAEFDTVIAHLAGKKQGTTTAPASVAPGKAEASKEVKVEKTSESKTEKTEAQKSDVAELSYAKDVAPAILKMAEAKGRDAVKEMFKAFGVTSGPQLKADQYAGVIKAVDNALLA